MIDTPVRSFFDTTLSTVLTAEGVDVATLVAWPGTAFDSTAVAEDTAWYQPQYIPFEPRSAGVGVLAQNRMRGIYDVDVFGPTDGNYSEQDIIDLAEPICEAFKRGVAFSPPVVPGTPHACVTCNKSWIFRSARDTLTARWVVTVRVKWEAYLDN